jgi:hypothetical protein
MKFCSQIPCVLAINRSFNVVTAKNKRNQKIKINRFRISVLNKIINVITVIITLISDEKIRIYHNYIKIHYIFNENIIMIMTWIYFENNRFIHHTCFRSSCSFTKITFAIYPDDWSFRPIVTTLRYVLFTINYLCANRTTEKLIIKHGPSVW